MLRSQCVYLDLATMQRLRLLDEKVDILYSWKIQVYSIHGLDARNHALL